MKKLTLTVLLLLAAFFAAPSSSFADVGAYNGLHADTSVKLQAAGDDLSGDAFIMGIELDRKHPCRNFMDCGCFGCDRGADAGSALATMAKAYAPVTDAAGIKIFMAEDIPVSSAALYINPQFLLPLRPPRSF